MLTVLRNKTRIRKGISDIPHIPVSSDTNKWNIIEKWCFWIFPTSIKYYI